MKNESSLRSEKEHTMSWYQMLRIALPAVLLVSTLTGRALAQEDQKMMGCEKMMEHREGMMAKHQEMMAELESMDTELDSLIAAMNAATGDDKVNAMAAVLEELVGQRKAMREKMQQRNTRMMQGMGGMHDKEGEARGDEQ
jgi:hypothetical protein